MTQRTVASWRREPALTDIAKDDAIALFDRAEFRVTEFSGEIFWNREAHWNALQILHDGKWKDVSRTDMMDDVATGLIETKTMNDWIKYYREAIVYGARVDDRRFSVIDSMSDG